ncbi:uncharacterized protein BDR25DRAFT_397087 [Lindgomyces ingoldianus]|uniref:Uncharacterized protein n=1 Tax=Lindgomyces ingoldianus TaxID=673940 RepID=A0ACB6QAX6_9PLEO|nr:uncharacterized protein BDR25DRAFT_397087 [Lindgomyces ingoldianus]KAF2463645.1 hypothetical protein BDR25DRAFT_397087 [Lindgomyces ingoldianus]
MEVGQEIQLYQDLRSAYAKFYERTKFDDGMLVADDWGVAMHEFEEEVARITRTIHAPFFTHFLTALPREIRDQVYEYLLDEETHHDRERAALLRTRWEFEQQRGQEVWRCATHYSIPFFARPEYVGGAIASEIVDTFFRQLDVALDPNCKEQHLFWDWFGKEIKVVDHIRRLKLYFKPIPPEQKRNGEYPADLLKNRIVNRYYEQLSAHLSMLSIIKHRKGFQLELIFGAGYPSAQITPRQLLRTLEIVKPIYLQLELSSFIITTTVLKLDGTKDLLGIYMEHYFRNSLEDWLVRMESCDGYDVDRKLREEAEILGTAKRRLRIQKEQHDCASETSAEESRGIE